MRSLSWAFLRRRVLHKESGFTRPERSVYGSPGPRPGWHRVRHNASPGGERCTYAALTGLRRMSVKHTQGVALGWFRSPLWGWSFGLRFKRTQASRAPADSVTHHKRKIARQGCWSPAIRPIELVGERRASSRSGGEGTGRDAGTGGGPPSGKTRPVPGRFARRSKS